jgi:hypothetical protein
LKDARTALIELAQIFLSGSHPVFNRKPPAAFHIRDSQIYRFLSLVPIPDVERTILTCFTTCPFAMMGNYLEAISKLNFNPCLYGQWGKTLKTKMSAAIPFLNEIMLGFVMTIVRYRLPRFTIDILS